LNLFYCHFKSFFSWKRNWRSNIRTTSWMDNRMHHNTVWRI